MFDLKLNIQKLNCQYSDRVILQDVNFTAEPGMVLGLQGHNGCGKSTLMATIAGLLPYPNGTITWGNDQQRISCQPEDIAWMGVHSPFYEQLSVVRNLRLWAVLNNINVSIINTILHHYEIEFLADSAVQELSRGQLQRLALCRLHLTAAKIWLLDEPLTGLDHQGYTLFKQSIQQFQQHGGIVIMAPDNIDLQNHVINVEDFCVR